MDLCARLSSEQISKLKKKMAQKSDLIVPVIKLNDHEKITGQWRPIIPNNPKSKPKTS